ncbi:radical SAM/SPASM domain-containing protein [Acidobacteriota bacterium]
MNLKKDFTLHLESFKQRQVQVDFGPAVLYIESVKGCPYACVMCRFKQTRPNRISEALLKKIDLNFKDLEIMAIHGQGEPLLADLNYFVEQSARHKLILHMNTTGFLLTKEVADLLLRTRLSIRFSINAGRPETYKRIMGYDFDRVKRNISYLVSKTKDSEENHDFWFSYIVMKENIDEIEDFLQLASDCGIKSIRFMRLVPNWQSLIGFKMRDRDFKFNYFEQYNRRVAKKFLARLTEYQTLSNKLDIKIEYSSILPKGIDMHPLLSMVNTVSTKMFPNNIFPLTRIRGSCMAPWFGQLIVNLKGDVKLCCSSSYILGSLNDSTLLEIWNSERMKTIRKSFAKGNKPRVCGYCNGFGLENYPKNAFRELRS